MKQDSARILRPADPGPMNELIFVLTTRCNQRCSFCCEPPGEPDIDLIDAMRWVETVARSGVPAVDFSGGEPLLYPGISQIVRFAHSLGLFVTLSTNGVLADQHIDELAPYIDQWNVSLHGVAEVHDEITKRRGSHDRILSVARSLVASGAIVHITHVVTPANLQTVNQCVAELAEAGVQKLCFNYVFKRGRGEQYLAQRVMDSSSAKALVTSCLSDLAEHSMTVYHNANLDGQCALVRHNGDVWAVPMSNGQDFEVAFHVDDIQTAAWDYRYLDHHRQFSYPRLSPPALANIEFPMIASPQRFREDDTSN